MFKNFLDRFFYAMAPCVLCLSRDQQAAPLCQDCMDALPWMGRSCMSCGLPLSENRIGLQCGPCLLMPPVYNRVQTLFEYTWPCDQFIFQIKFKKKLEWVHFLARLMAQHFVSTPEDRPTCLIPVPLQIDRLKERGFNQAYVLAKKIGQILDIPVIWDMVKKTKKTPAQSSLSLEQRHKNLRSAFEVNPLFPKRFYSKVAIIDDVLTTGATASALTMALKAVGIQEVEVWCCCRTLKSVSA